MRQSRLLHGTGRNWTGRARVLNPGPLPGEKSHGRHHREASRKEEDLWPQCQDSPGCGGGSSHIRSKVRVRTGCEGGPAPGTRTAVDAVAAAWGLPVTETRVLAMPEEGVPGSTTPCKFSQRNIGGRLLGAGPCLASSSVTLAGPRSDPARWPFTVPLTHSHCTAEEIGYTAGKVPGQPGSGDNPRFYPSSQPLSWVCSPHMSVC